MISGAYQRWRKAAEDALWGQKLVQFTERVIITITVPDKGRGDADNYAKACVDLLKRIEVIEDDSRKFVQRVSVGFGNVEQCEVEVQVV